MQQLRQSSSLARWRWENAYFAMHALCMYSNVLVHQIETLIDLLDLGTPYFSKAMH